MKSISFAAAASLAVLTWQNPANAAVVVGATTGGTAFLAGGAFQIIAPPASVGFDNFNDNKLRAFNEVQNFLLTSALTVNTLAAGGPGSIIAGTKISSHLVVFDPAGSQRDPTQPSISGYAVFSAPVVGVIWRDRTLTATNALLGAAGTAYLTPAGVGLEQGSDFFTIGTGANANRITFNFLSATSPGDEIRVITADMARSAVPEPATWLSLIVGFGAIGSVMRRTRQAQTA